MVLTALTDLALRAVAARPRVLLATMPGGTAVRLAAERSLRLQDLPLAATPAQSDMLLIVGPECSALEAALERLWKDMPAPRARAHAVAEAEVAPELANGRTALAHSAQQRMPPSAGTGNRPRGGAYEPGEDKTSDAGGDQHDGRAHGGHGDLGDDGEHGGSEGHGGHGGHGGMEMPGGLPMAEVAEDRDGLTLDRLRVPLGPLLADWPAGLTVRLMVQGDVVQQAGLDDPVRTGPAEVFWAEPWRRAVAGEPVTTEEAVRRRASAHLDSLGRLLAVAGWPAEAVAARRLRDQLLSGAPGAVVAPGLQRLLRRVGRSRTLAWSTRGIGVVTEADAREAGVSGPAERAGGDVMARVRQWLADVRDDVARLDERTLLDVSVEQSPRGWWNSGRPPSVAVLSLLPRLLQGAELAGVRLIVASLDPDMDEITARSAVAHG